MRFSAATALTRRRYALMLLLATALPLAGCGGKPAAPQEQAVARTYDVLQRPQVFRQAFAELKARPELKGHKLKAFQYVFFHDDGLVMLKLQNPRRPGQLDHYEYRPATGDRPVPTWDGPTVFARDQDEKELAPQLIPLDDLPLQALPIADAALDRQLEALKARHPDKREDLAQADSDRSIYFVVGGRDGEQRWESTLNSLYAWQMNAYRFTFHRDGTFDKLEETPPPSN
jgi:hypothetical protein